MTKYSNVIVKNGGPFSLYCTSCKRWVPNTANAEMKKEGFFANAHFCVDGKPIDDDGSVADTHGRRAWDDG